MGPGEDLVESKMRAAAARLVAYTDARVANVVH